VERYYIRPNTRDTTLENWTKKKKGKTKDNLSETKCWFFYIMEIINKKSRRWNICTRLLQLMGAWRRLRAKWLDIIKQKKKEYTSTLGFFFWKINSGQNEWGKNWIYRTNFGIFLVFKQQESAMVSKFFRSYWRIFSCCCYITDTEQEGVGV